MGRHPSKKEAGPRLADLRAIARHTVAIRTARSCGVCAQRHTATRALESIECARTAPLGTTRAKRERMPARSIVSFVLHERADTASHQATP